MSEGKRIMFAVGLSDLTCNGRCEYCSAGYQFGQEKAMFKPDWGAFKESVLKYIEEREAEDGKLPIEAEIWGGEPTVNRNTLKAIEVVNDLIPDVRIAIVTNGYALPNVIKDYPDNVEFIISNDMLNQTKYRGIQVLEDEKWCSMLRDEKRIVSFQSVVGADFDLVANYCYFRDKQDGLGLNRRLYFGLIPIKDYGDGTTTNSFTFDNYIPFYASVMQAFPMLIAEMESGRGGVLEKGLLKHYTRTLSACAEGLDEKYDYKGCTVFTNSASIALDGRRWRCTHFLERGWEYENMLAFKGTDYEEVGCSNCTFLATCHGICRGVGTEISKANCTSMWLYHSAWRRSYLFYDNLKHTAGLKENAVLEAYFPAKGTPARESYDKARELYVNAVMEGKGEEVTT